MSSKPSEANVKKLVAMGYTKSRATKALKECHNNVKSATSLLLKWQREAGEKEAKEALEKAKKQEADQEAQRLKEEAEKKAAAAAATSSSNGAAEWDSSEAGGIPNDPAILSATAMPYGKPKQGRLADLNPRGVKRKFDKKQPHVSHVNGDATMLNQPVVVPTPDGLGQMLLDPNGKSGGKVFKAEQVEAVPAVVQQPTQIELLQPAMQQSAPEASAWNTTTSSSSNTTYTDPLVTSAPSGRRVGDAEAQQVAQSSTAALPNGNGMPIQLQQPKQHVPIFQQDVTSAEDAAAASSPFLERLKMGLAESGTESPEPSTRRGAEAALRQVAVNDKGQVLPTATEFQPTFRSNKRHPCVVQHGSCHFGDHCHHAHLPGDVCVHWLNGHCRYDHGTCRFRHELPEGEDKVNYNIKEETPATTATTSSQQATPGQTTVTSSSPAFTPTNSAGAQAETPASHTNGFILSANPAATAAMTPGYADQALSGATQSQPSEQYWDSPQGMYDPRTTPPGMAQSSDYWRQQQQSSHPAALFQQQQSFAQQQRQQHYAAPGMPSAAAAQYYQEDHTHGGLMAANGGSPHPAMGGGFIPGFHHAGPLDHSGMNTPNTMDPFGGQMMGGMSHSGIGGGAQDDGMGSRSHSRYATPPSGIQSASPAGKGERLAPDGRPLCKYFQFGGCDRGDDCPFSHDLTIQAESHTEAQQGFVLSGNIGGNVRNLNKGKTPGSMGSPAPSF